MLSRVSLLLAVLILFSLGVQSSYLDYLYPNRNPSFNSYGEVGLIQMPSARFLESGSLAINYSDFDPYSRLSIVAYPFDWLEASYQYTDIKNKLYSENFLFSGNQTYKDKGFNFKVRLLEEKGFMPQVTLGFRDLGGTGLFSGEYAVLSKSYQNIDFTIGMGWGNLSSNEYKNPLRLISERFNNRPGYNTASEGGQFSLSTYFRGESVGIFGGVEIFFSRPRNFRFKAEYDSTNYFTEGFQPIKISSRNNYSLLYTPNKTTTLSLGWIRGDTLQLGFNLSVNFSKKNNLQKRIDPYQKIERSSALKQATSIDDRYLYLASLRYMNDNELFLRTAHRDNEKLTVSFAQNKYLSYPVSYGRAIRTLDDLAPADIKRFELIAMNNLFELVSVEVDREQFSTYKKNNDYFALTSSISIDKSFDSISNHDFKPKTLYPRIFFKYGPDIQSHIGGPDRFFVGGLNFRLDSEILFHKRLSLQTILRQSVATSFDVLEQPSNSILPHVRTDIIEYLKESEGFAISRMQFNSFWQPSKNTYLRFSHGIFEEMFGGYGFEFLYRPFSSNQAIGIEVYKAKQRSYRQLLDYRRYSTITGHITYYHKFDKQNILLKLIGGKYLAKDSGITLDISKRFKSGLVMGIFASKTDISSFEFGEGSFDKGLFINIPLESIFPLYSRQLSHFGIRPITRDGAARMIVGHDLYGVTDQSSLSNISRDLEDFYD